MNRRFSDLFENFVSEQIIFSKVLGVLEGLESSGKPVGKNYTNPGTYKSQWCRVMTKNPGGNFFFRVRYVARKTKENRLKKHRKQKGKF